MGLRWWRTGITELRHAASKRAFAAAAADYVPEIGPSDFHGGFSGVRAQAVARDGALVDDFVISETGHALHVRNAPSPAATSSLALAGMIADNVDSLARP
jgi:(S)-2-hydroxyglutarate dehydrogenase